MAMAGDAFPVYFTVNVSGEYANDSTFENIEVTIGQFRKMKSDGGVKYDSRASKFYFMLTQEETFTFAKKKISPQIRCKFQNGNVLGFRMEPISFDKSDSTEVL